MRPDAAGTAASGLDVNIQRETTMTPSRHNITEPNGTPNYDQLRHRLNELDNELGSRELTAHKAKRPRSLWSEAERAEFDQLDAECAGLDEQVCEIENAIMAQPPTSYDDVARKQLWILARQQNTGCDVSDRMVTIIKEWIGREPIVW